MKYPNADQWQKAAEEEMNAYAWNSIWDIVLLSESSKAIGSCWVFKMKHNMSGFVKRYKACLVIKGFSYYPRFDYFKTFAPIAKFVAICAILAHSALNNFYLHFVDISYVFIKC